LGLLASKLWNFQSVEEYADEFTEEFRKQLGYSLPKRLWKELQGKEVVEQMAILSKEDHRSLQIKFLVKLWNEFEGNFRYHSVKQFVESECESLGLPLHWKGGDISKKLTREKRGELSFLSTTNAQSLVSEMRNAEDALQMFFKTKGRKGRPRFKKIAFASSFDNQNNKHEDPSKLQNRIMACDKFVKLKIMKYANGIRMIQHRSVDSPIGTVTISRTPAGAYYASFPTEVDEAETRTVTKDTSLGLDLGLTGLITDDKARVIAPVKTKKEIVATDKKLAVLQKRLQKKRDRNPHWKQSKRYKKEKQRVAMLCEKVANQRRDYIHKATDSLISEDVSLLGVEDLNIQGMLKNHCLAKSISNAGWYQIRTQLEYKSKLRGATVLSVGRFFPSSKKCSACGHVAEKMPLDVREWICNNCGAEHDRDQNAAINIKEEAFNTYSRTVGRLSDSK
jgi:putative transposase